MNMDNLVSLYVLTQGEIDKLWEYFLVSQLALIGWLVTVSECQVQRARRVLTVSFLILTVALGYFFYDGYTDLALIQTDIKAVIAQMDAKTITTSDHGFVNQLLHTDIQARFNRVIIVFFASFTCALYLLNHPRFGGQAMPTKEAS
ncbi:hypothetical protein N480_19315 [Pseudoalteromonas luteoviolacea S2607]|nr:hypothetical protein N480_19315 [Pseudoalteromonas luteoviolacea S2607]